MNGFIASVHAFEFIAVGNSKNPFRCPGCVIAKQSKEIAELKASVVDLYREVAILQEKTKTSLTGAQKVEGSKTSDNLPATSPLHPTLIAQPVPSRHPSSEPDKKFNVVVFGISEFPKGTSRYYRSSNDYDKASSLLSNLEKDFICTIRDCRRIGKYNSDHSHPRPLLVTLNSTAEVRHSLLIVDFYPPP